MFEGKYGFKIINPNEITKSQFDELKEVNDFDIISKEQYAMTLAAIQSLIKKGETEELSEEEVTSVNEGIAELKTLKKYTINEMIDGRIVKSMVFVGEKQVHWQDTIEKSETGEKIERGTFLDTELNRNLNRVGISFEKGKKAEKKEDKEDEVDAGMYKSAMSMIKKGDSDKKSIFKALKESNKDKDDKLVSAAVNKAYKACADEMMKAANEDMSDDDDGEGKEEKSKK